MNRAEALQIALDYINRLRRESGIDLTLEENAIEERAFGWVFFYRAGDDVLAGNAPFIVDRTDGSVHVTGTARPIHEYLDDYARFHDASRH